MREQAFSAKAASAPKYYLATLVQILSKRMQIHRLLNTIFLRLNLKGATEL